MKKLTPEELYKKLDQLLEQYPGIAARCVKFAVQLETLTAMPKGEFVGAYWDSEYGVIVYSNKADRAYVNKYASTDSALYWAKSPSVHWALQKKNAGKTEQPKRGRPKKDWTAQYMQLLELRDSGLSDAECAEHMKVSLQTVKRIRENYKKQQNMC